MSRYAALSPFEVLRNVTQTLQCRHQHGVDQCHKGVPKQVREDLGRLHVVGRVNGGGTPILKTEFFTARLGSALEFLPLANQAILNQPCHRAEFVERIPNEATLRKYQEDIASWCIRHNLPSSYVGQRQD